MEGGEAQPREKKERRDQSAHQSQNLPNDVVFDILSRLPVRSLLQFKSVCKSWRSIISHPQFIKTHLEKSKNSADHHKLLLLIDEFLCLMEISSLRSEVVPSPWTKKHSYCYPLCSCDGLILLAVQYRRFFNRNPCKSFLLWNPSIRSYKMISFTNENRPCLVAYGLCYDSNVDDYRVVVVSQKFRSSTTVIYHCNSKSSQWDMIDEPRYSMQSEENGLLVNGDLHWVMNSNEFGSWVIVYFDLVEAKLKEVPRPSFENDSDETCLAVLRGYLCLYRDLDWRGMEIWAMKEYGKKESWTPLIFIPGTTNNFLYSKPLCFTRYGQVLLLAEDEEIVSYEPQGDTLLPLTSGGCSLAVKYVESLVLLNGGCQVSR